MPSLITIDLAYASDLVRGTVLLALVIPARIARSAYRTTIISVALVRSLLVLRRALAWRDRLVGRDRAQRLLGKPELYLRRRRNQLRLAIQFASLIAMNPDKHASNFAGPAFVVPRDVDRSLVDDHLAKLDMRPDWNFAAWALAPAGWLRVPVVMIEPERRRGAACT